MRFALGINVHPSSNDRTADSSAIIRDDIERYRDTETVSILPRDRFRCLASLRTVSDPEDEVRIAYPAIFHV
jgi:hypothetical protein